MKTKLKFIFLSVSLTLFATALIIYPERYVSACLGGWVLWAECVLPSLFPFSVIALFLTKSGIAERVSLPLRRVTGVFHLPPTAAVCFAISICSGYPVGARVLAEMYQGGQLNAADVKKLAPLCSSSGPLFILGTVGYKMLNSKFYGFIILACHILSVLLSSLIFCLFTKKSKNEKPYIVNNETEILYNTFYSATISVAVAGGFISFFSVLSKILSDFYVLYPIELAISPLLGKDGASGFLAALVEVTTGCLALSKCNPTLAVPLIGFAITFGGGCILCQQLAYLKKARVNTLYFVTAKAVQGGVCFAALKIILLLC